MIVLIALVIVGCITGVITKCILSWRNRHVIDKLEGSEEEDRRQAIIMAQILKEKNAKDHKKLKQSVKTGAPLGPVGIQATMPTENLETDLAPPTQRDMIKKSSLKKSIISSS